MFNSKSVALFFSVILISLTSFASPWIGDSATYAGIANYQGQQISYEVSQTIIAVNSPSDQFLVRRVTSSGGQTQSEDEWTSGDEIISAQTGKMLVENCAEIGAPEQINVTAGIFSSCRVTTNDGSIIHIGAVPFGVIKGQSAEGTFQLKSYTIGYK